MDMNNAAVFLSGSILIGLGFCAIAIAIVFVNNLFHKFWKPVQLFRFDALPPGRFATEEEMQAEKSKK